MANNCKSFVWISSIFVLVLTFQTITAGIFMSKKDYIQEDNLEAHNQTQIEQNKLKNHSNSTAHSVNTCGGILRGNSGSISFNRNKLENASNDELVCVWTIQTESSNRLAFQISNNQLAPGSVLTLTPLWPSMLLSTSCQSWLCPVLDSRSHGTYNVSGKTILVTFVSHNNLLPSSIGGEEFQLSFNGHKFEDTDDSYHFEEYDYIDEYNDYVFSNYHFTASSGSVNYTELTGRLYYLPNEIITMIISTSHNHTFYFNYIDIENTTSCDSDFIARFYVPYKQDYILPCGRPHLNYRECGTSPSLNNSQKACVSTTSIVIFKSDASEVETGFKFSWEPTKDELTNYGLLLDEATTIAPEKTTDSFQEKDLILDEKTPTSFKVFQ